MPLQKHDLDGLLRSYTLPDVWRDLQLPPPVKHGKNSFEAYVPWREKPGTSKRPSLCCVNRAGIWFFKDMARQEKGGTAIHLIAKTQNIPYRDAVKTYIEMAAKRGYVKDNSLTGKAKQRASVSHQPRIPTKPERPDGLRQGTAEDFAKLAAARQGLSVASLQRASAMGWLYFSTCRGREAWWVTDQSGWTYQRRRLDGKQWVLLDQKLPVAHERKAMSQTGNAFGWPVGVLDIGDRKVVAVCEGEPDFLALNDFIVNAGLEQQVAPIAFLGAGGRFKTELALSTGYMERLRGKDVLLFCQNDQASGDGTKAAEIATRRWAAELKPMAKSTHIVSIGTIGKALGIEVKDLNDLTPHRDKFNSWRLFGHYIRRGVYHAPTPGDPLPMISQGQQTNEPAAVSAKFKRLVSSFEVGGKGDVFLIFDGARQDSTTTLYARLSKALSGPVDEAVLLALAQHEKKQEVVLGKESGRRLYLGMPAANKSYDLLVTPNRQHEALEINQAEPREQTR